MPRTYYARYAMPPLLVDAAAGADAAEFHAAMPCFADTMLLCLHTRYAYDYAERQRDVMMLFTMLIISLADAAADCYAAIIDAAATMPLPPYAATPLRYAMSATLRAFCHAATMRFTRAVYCRRC